MTNYLIPAELTRTQITVRNSRFIATGAPVFTVEEARAFISEIKSEFSNASHNVSAFIIGHGNSKISHCTDAGEPSGTAGRPVLSVLEGSGLGDIVVVITRYFGGIKLGTGGLVKAYSKVTKNLLSILPHAKKVRTHTLMIAISYPLYERILHLIERFHAELIEQEFAGDVTLTFRIEASQTDSIQAAIQEMTHGQISAVVIDTRETIKKLGY
jgi:uncharacterized YigZ family protein